MTAKREKSMSHEAKASQINELGSTSVWLQHFTSTNLLPHVYNPTSPIITPHPSICSSCYYCETGRASVCARTTSPSGQVFPLSTGPCPWKEPCRLPPSLTCHQPGGGVKWGWSPSQEVCEGSGGGVGGISWWYLSQVTPPLSPNHGASHPVPPTNPTPSHQDPPGWGVGWWVRGGRCTAASPLDAHTAEDDGRVGMSCLWRGSSVIQSCGVPKS